MHNILLATMLWGSGAAASECDYGGIRKIVMTKEGVARAARLIEQCPRWTAGEKIVLYGELSESERLYGRHKEAERHAQVAMEAAEATPDVHPMNVAQTYETFAKALSARGRNVDAEPFIRKAIGIAERSMPGSGLHAAYLNTLALLYARLDDPEGAERILARAWPMVETLDGHAVRMAVAHNRAIVAARLGNKERARAMMQEVERSGFPPEVVRSLKALKELK